MHSFVLARSFAFARGFAGARGFISIGSQVNDESLLAAQDLGLARGSRPRACSRLKPQGLIAGQTQTVKKPPSTGKTTPVI
ncbi:MAG: hypothetical protein EBX62_07200, partial [Betaproteobacteria bacterium]|nr:hypothetical protein [Betaproteobacteria bacterium]